MRLILSLLILAVLAIPALANGYGQQQINGYYQPQQVYVPQPIVQRQRVYVPVQRIVQPQRIYVPVQQQLNDYCAPAAITSPYAPAIQQNFYPQQQRRGLIRRIMGY